MTDALLMLDEAAVRGLFTPEVALDSQRRAFSALASGAAVLPPRLLVPGENDAVAFCYAARLAPDAAAVSKFGSVNPANTKAGLPSISALITVLDAATGRPVAVLDGTAVTTLRTAAASAVALDVCAPARVERLAVFGTGVQAVAHVAACLSVRDVAEVLVVGSSLEQGQAAVSDIEAGIEAVAGDGVRVRAVDHEAACAQADALALCTTSSAPVVREQWIRPGTTILSVGSFAPDRCEFSPELLRSARLVVDDPATAASDCGPVVDALAAGIVARDDLVGLGDVLLGRSPGRASDDEVVLYASVGVGVQDAAAAEAITELARER